MTAPARKKLIEVALPLDAINAASAREKSIRHGHPSTLHLWWARRPLATARAVLFAQLVDDPDSDTAPRAFVEACRALPAGKHAATEDTPRHRLFDFISELVTWENTTNETVLEKAHDLIMLATDGNPPPVLDPFSGGATIPLEAQRLGLEAHGSDLNPVAVMIGKASIEIPPRFAGLPPVRSTDRYVTGGSWRGAQGLAEDVRYYGRWMKEEAERRIGHLYPKAKLPDGGEATIIAWLWARTVKCPNPACGADMQLVSSFELSTKQGKRAWVEPEIDRSATPPRVVYHVRAGTGQAPEPPKTGRGANFRCLCCCISVSDAHIKTEGKVGRMGTQPMAVVAEGSRGRIYLAPTEEMQQVAEAAVPDWVPDQPMPKNPRWFSPPDYGMPLFSDVFTPRQLVALTTFSDLVAEARDRVLEDARSAGLEDDDIPLRDGGRGARAYAEAISVYLAFAVDKGADNWSSITTWASPRETFRNTFSRQALPMTWDFAEANPFSDSASNFFSLINSISSALDTFYFFRGGAQQSASATDIHIGNKVVSTDPPYYDNIGYADLSDFFYVWLRRSLRSVYPDLFSTMLVPKAEELVATPYRHGSKKQAEAFFMSGMTRAISNIMTHGNQDYPTAIYYAFKQAEVKEDGVSSTGWATFLEAVLQAGFTINGTWPVRTEREGRSIGVGTNALASSIVLVCRPRPPTALLATRSDFLRDLRRELPEALRALTASNIAPVDMAQASIGPGMAVYSRYKQVLEPDGSQMSVRTALQLINAALDEYFSEQEGHMDEYTRFAVTWFESFGMEEDVYGKAEQIATARGVSVQGVADAGLFVARGGHARLLKRSELNPDWDPQMDTRPTVWEAVQHLVRAQEAGGDQQAGVLLARLGGLADGARNLAYRLYGICERKGWSQEGQAYNALVASWSEASEVARNVGPVVTQDSFAFGGEV